MKFARAKHSFCCSNWRADRSFETRVRILNRRTRMIFIAHLNRLQAAVLVTIEFRKRKVGRDFKYNEFSEFKFLLWSFLNEGTV